MTNSRVDAAFEKYYRECFDIFDEDKSGNIDSRELGNVLRALGFNPTEQNVKEYLTKIDTDKSNTIEYEEFRNFIINLEQKKPEPDQLRSDLLAAFKLFDLDGNGFLSSDELKNIVKTMGESLTEDDCKNLVQEADSDNDGHVDYAEFVERMLKL
ncbi:calmodulin-beta-like [Mizuhopecten yessoensis]|uniref:calmodulin-beta-like n=1 Tax=Mizuhopecten yessoensis TaxID=6573 RepID=UPI000B45B17D|nr:calmodulin-beta-like [Mizuhopecten yessoensis]